MMFHHEITLEMSLLNKGILQNSKKKKKSKQTENQAQSLVVNTENSIINQPKVLKSEITNSKREKKKNLVNFSYWQIFCFKYLCCQKNTKKYKEYIVHCKAIKQRLDVNSLIISNGNVNALSEVLLDPY
jgi:hypothetical protein